MLRRALAAALRPTRANVLHWSSWGVALAIQLTAVWVLRNGRIFEWEASVARQIQRIPRRYELFDGVNYSTNTIAIEFVPLFALVVVGAWALREREGAVLLLLTFPLHVLAQWPKAVVERERPPAGFTGVDGIGGLQSFPSGHAEFVITFWGFIAYLVALRAPTRKLQLTIAASAAAFAAAAGIGRIAIGRHWPLDVLVAYVVGLGLLSGLVWLHRSLRAARSADADAAQSATLDL